MATIGPMHRMMAHIRSSAGILPSRSVTASLLPTSQQGEHAQQRQTDVRDEIGGEAQQPLRAGLHAQVRREDHVARTEKHGKQRKADDNDVPDGVVTLLHTSFSPLLPDFVPNFC